MGLAPKPRLTRPGRVHRSIVDAACRRHGTDIIVAIIRQHGYRYFDHCPPERRPELIDRICSLDHVRPAFVEAA